MATRTATSAVSRIVARSAGKQTAARAFSSVAQQSARPAARQTQAALASAFSVSGPDVHLVPVSLTACSHFFIVVADSNRVAE